MQQPTLRPKYLLSPIWILPLVALLIGSWLLYTSIQNAGIEITIHLANAKGITPGKTKVIFRGIPIGTVKDIEIDKDMQGVNLVVEMENRAQPFLVKDTLFWVVKPEVSAGKISGLETLFGGSYIGARQGSSGEAAFHFQGLETPPPLNPNIPGLRFTLESDTLYSLQRGSYIYSQNLQIGQIEDYALQDNGKILFTAHIKPGFAHLIKTGTRFWNASGLSLSGDLRQGLSVNIESLASLVYGGVTCATHASLKDTPAAGQDSHFTLYKDFEAAEYGVPMSLRITSGEGIIAGKTQVLFRGLKVGIVKRLDINHDQFHTVTATILLDPRAEPILRESTRFWVIKPKVSVTGITNLGTLLGGNYITFTPGEGAYQNHFSEEPDPMPNQIVREGTSFQLQAEESGSLELGAPILYKQLVVGEISEIALSPGGETVTISIFLYQPYDRLIHRDTVFWNVSGISIDGRLSDFSINLASLQALLAGGIAFTNPKTVGSPPIPAIAGSIFPLYDDFNQALQANQALQPQGLRLRLTTRQLPPLVVGSPLFYNNIKVGQVLEVQLAQGEQTAQVVVLISEEHRRLVTSSSRFYDRSGIEIAASLKGVKIRAGSMDAILSGGLAFYTPPGGSPVDETSTFPLHAGYQEALHAKDLRLSLRFSPGARVDPQTEITYQGLEIGRVEEVELDPESDALVGKAYIVAKAAHLFCSDSQLWLIKPEVSLNGIRHLDTILSGPQIAVSRGSGPPRSEFTVLERPPRTSATGPGLTLVLESPRLGSLTMGSPLYYRRIQVGRVTGFKLSPTAQTVWIQVTIDPAFSHLIYSNSRFWQASGLTVKAGLFSGISVASESMTALVKGGIALATPEGAAMGTRARDGDHFPLAASGEKEWLLWQPVLPPKAVPATQASAEQPAAAGKRSPRQRERQPALGQEDPGDDYL
ncbi:MlaD family protein [Desulfogranum mediterraneum]|uniref:MlaD family protein n=1 Tax=Desulfogranum mediterraneum TaxID=160661 RepID=UPI0003FDF079|nr:MlaD family protein [Desulfogranum mediterraneum]